MIIQIGNVDLKVSLVDNEATRSLIERLKNGPITIAMNDYAKMEKVGD
ncbi:cyclophilin-like fold protein, partial [Thomasclavelia sp.]